MRIIQLADYAQLSQTAATLILNQLLAQPRLNLGLATGQTPSGLYAALVAAQQDLGLDLGQVQFFHLDEYRGLSPGDPESMAAFLTRQLLDPLQIAAQQRHFVPACSTDAQQACRDYDARIAAAGGLDLQILGLGHNGHIAFNEPGTPFYLGTHLIQLHPRTRAANARYFASGQTPAEALTLGCRSILSARSLMMLVTGADKAEAVAAMVHGPLHEDCPASVLRLHPDLTLILDQAAASRLQLPLPRFAPLPLQLIAHDQPLPGQRILVAAPHPDDAAIGCGGALARWQKQGAALHLVAMSSGHRADMPEATAAERGARREAEAAAEARCFGAEFTALNLPFYDQHYIPGSADIQAVVTLLRRWQPDCVLSASPQDRHPAHRASAWIVREALQVWQAESGAKVELWDYEGPWFVFERDAFNTVVPFDAAALAQKLAGIQAHQSQVSRKRYDLAAEALGTFRAITVPESRLSGFGSDQQNLGLQAEVFQRQQLQP